MISYSAKPSVSLIVPAFNEEKNLPQIFQTVCSLFPKLFSEFEVIVVDDGSSDGTSRVVEEWAEKYSFIRLLRQPKNLGVGAALRRAISQARYDWIFQAPADNQFNLAEIEKFIPYLDTNDIVQGYRTNLSYSWRRKFVSATYRRLLRLLFGVRLKDPTWVKMIRKDVAQSLTITSDGFFGEIEILIRAQKLGARFSEVGVLTQARSYGISTASQWPRIFKTFFELIRFRIFSGCHSRESGNPAKA